MEAFGGFEAGQTMAGACSCKTVLNPLKSRWQGHVAVRVVALEACGEFGGFEAGQTAGACRWLGHVADRGVALMVCAFACDPRAKFHTSGGLRRRSCLGKGRGRRMQL